MQAIAKDAARPRSFWLASQQFACLSKRLASVLAWVAGAEKRAGMAASTEAARRKQKAIVRSTARKNNRRAQQNTRLRAP
jgi:hypothetical protein